MLYNILLHILLTIKLYIYGYNIILFNSSELLKLFTRLGYQPNLITYKLNKLWVMNLYSISLFIYDLCFMVK